jgi:serine/threonine protein kinase
VKATGTLKIIDFGLACTTACRSGPGTITYIAPEIFSPNAPNGLAASQAHDIWSMGIVFYQLANLSFPYNIIDEMGKALRTRDIGYNIVNGPYYESHYMNSNNKFHVSNDTFNYIIDSMLIYNWQSRPTSTSLYRYVMDEDNGCVVTGVKYDRVQLLNALKDSNTYISDSNAFLSSICSTYFS